MFENICEQKIRPFNESDEEEEDVSTFLFNNCS